TWADSSTRLRGHVTFKARRQVPDTSRDRARGAAEPRPGTVGLSRGWYRDRDHSTAQSAGARLDRVPAARAPQRLEDRPHPDLIRAHRADTRTDRARRPGAGLTAV